MHPACSDQESVRHSGHSTAMESLTEEAPEQEAIEDIEASSPTGMEDPVLPDTLVPEFCPTAMVCHPRGLHLWSLRFMADLIAYNIIEGSLVVKLPTIWTDEKQRREESERREE